MIVYVHHVQVTVFIVGMYHETTIMYVIFNYYAGECRKGVLKLLERFKKKVAKNQVLILYLYNSNSNYTLIVIVTSYTNNNNSSSLFQE